MEKLKKPLMIVAGGLVIFIIFMFILASCNKKNYTCKEFSEYLLEEAKAYYGRNNDLLPKNDGGKTNVSISTLVDDQEKYLGDNTCSGSIDVINNNGFYMYSPNINCSDGYKTQKLSTYLTSADKIVNTGNGLYAAGADYIYRGDNVDNYILFNKQLWRILKINSDGSLRIIETNYKIKSNNDDIEYKSSRRTSVVWDDRYNTEKSYSSGFNDYIHENINSRIKDSLEDIYNNEYDENIKGYIVPQDLCVGKRALNDAVNDGSVECSNIIYSQYIGLIQLNEYINASLDTACVSAESVTCSNYNYLATFNSTFWTITPVKDNSYEIYKVGNNISDATANSTATPRVVITLSSDAVFSDGEGTYENPYMIN